MIDLGTATCHQSHEPNSRVVPSYKLESVAGAMLMYESSVLQTQDGEWEGQPKSYGCDLLQPLQVHTRGS